jgi:phage host-nuclease inhibitor protein Gam
MMADVLKKADALLDQIGSCRQEVEAVEAQMKARIDAVREEYAEKLQYKRQWLADMEKDLRALMRSEKDRLFPHKHDDLVDLPHGTLLRQVTERVKRARHVLERIEAAGWDSLIRISKSVHWDAVDKLKDGELEVIGAERIRRERFEYELQRGK